MSESKKSLCDTCLYAYNCVYSDKGISGANHSICNVYVPIEELITELNKIEDNEATRGKEE